MEPPKSVLSPTSMKLSQLMMIGNSFIDECALKKQIDLMSIEQLSIFLELDEVLSYAQIYDNDFVPY